MHARKFALVQINAQNEEKKKYQDKRCQSQINLPIGTSDSIGVQAKKKKKLLFPTNVCHKKNSNSCMTPGGNCWKKKSAIKSVTGTYTYTTIQIEVTLLWTK